MIVVGPELKLHQCGLPKKMALELFKPFVMRRLVQQGLAHNIKSAKRIVERVRARSLGRAGRGHQGLPGAAQPRAVAAPALDPGVRGRADRRLGHPDCTRWSARPSTPTSTATRWPSTCRCRAAAQKEARERMLSVNNILSPAHGDPMVSPSQDIVLGCYYMTVMRTDGEPKGDGKVFANPAEAILAYHSEAIDLQAPIMVRMSLDGSRPQTASETTPGRIIFNEVLEPLQRRDARRGQDRLPQPGDGQGRACARSWASATASWAHAARPRSPTP